VIQRHGWTLLFHEGVIEQLRKLQAAAERAERSDPQGFEANANVKLFRALSQLIMDVVPSDPSRDEFRQGNTLGRRTATGGARRSDGDSVCFSATTPGRR
jgi:toxin YhaV